MKVLILNGVNMNMLGKRDPNYYGTETLKQVEKYVDAFAKAHGVQTVFKQSNCEGKLCDLLQRAKCDAVVFNAGAYSHYSIALRDCIECIGIPVVEVHMSDVNSREDFRKVDVLQEVCEKRFMGKGKDSYVEALEYLLNK